MTKITGTNTYIDVELDDRTVRILGEMIVGDSWRFCLL